MRTSPSADASKGCIIVEKKRYQRADRKEDQVEEINPLEGGRQTIDVGTFRGGGTRYLWESGAKEVRRGLCGRGKDGSASARCSSFLSLREEGSRDGGPVTPEWQGGLQKIIEGRIAVRRRRLNGRREKRKQAVGEGRDEAKERMRRPESATS